ncbi:hypothetical protein KEM54_003016 [Ascosphaera aggregata]|nr:hypothetical protein KEM54_003016 [Ascosphaera aggregata]
MNARHQQTLRWDDANRDADSFPGNGGGGVALVDTNAAKSAKKERWNLDVPATENAETPQWLRVLVPPLESQKQQVELSSLIATDLLLQVRHSIAMPLFPMD